MSGALLPSCHTLSSTASDRRGHQEFNKLPMRLTTMAKLEQIPVSLLHQKNVRIVAVGACPYGRRHCGSDNVVMVEAFGADVKPNVGVATTGAMTTRLGASRGASALSENLYATIARCCSGLSEYRHPHHQFPKIASRKLRRWFLVASIPAGRLAQASYREIRLSAVFSDTQQRDQQSTSHLCSSVSSLAGASFPQRLYK